MPSGLEDLCIEKRVWLAKNWDFELVDIICLELAFCVSYFIRHWNYIGVYTEEYLQMGLGLLYCQLFLGRY